MVIEMIGFSQTEILRVGISEKETSNKNLAFNNVRRSAAGNDIVKCRMGRILAKLK